MRFVVSMLFAAIAMMASSAALAGGPLVVESHIFAERKVAAADGTVQVKLEPAARAVPGDGIVFVLSYRNTGGQPIGDLVFENPLPQGIAYQAPAAGSPQPELSVDGRTYGALGTLNIAAPGGGRRAATPADVTHVRWRLAAPLAAGGKGEFSFRGRLK